MKEAKGQFDAGVHLSDLAIKDLHWWLRNILGSKAPITRGQADLIIETDASLRVEVAIADHSIYQQVDLGNKMKQIIILMFWNFKLCI